MELPDYYDILDICRDATSTEIIQSYRLAISTYDADSQASYSMFDEQQLLEIRSEVEEAYKTLSHSERRRVYDSLLNSTTGKLPVEGDENVYYLNFQTDESRASEKDVITGLQLKNIRKSRGISLEMMAQRTGLSVRDLQAIEEEEITLLENIKPLKDSLLLYASEIGSDAEQLSRAYRPLNRR